MTGSNSRKRLTVIASIEGVGKAEKALTRLGFESKTQFAEAQLVARTAVSKFFNRQPVQLDTFKRVCEGLKLDWQEILDSESKANTGQRLAAGQPEVVEMSAPATSQNLGITAAISRQITVLDPQRVVKTVIVLKGDLDSIDANFKATLEVILKSYGGDTIEVIDIQAGSIRITIQGSEQDVARLRERIASGELTQISDFPIEAIEGLGEEPLEASETPSTQAKWEIVQTIKTQRQRHRQLREIDLSDADLSGADLSWANLSGANLSRADLSGADLSNSTAHDRDLTRNRDLTRDRVLFLASARFVADFSGTNLSGANLSGANLSGSDFSGANLSGTNLSGTNLSGANLSGSGFSGANLSGTNLSGANLSGSDFSGANLSGTNLSGAFVENTYFGQGIGLSDSEKRDLERRGAIFDESVGDRGSVYSPINR